MAQTKTDNSFLSDKVALRIGALPDCDPVRVLDCYAGSGKVWAAVKKLTGRNIKRLPIDIKDDFGFCLPGDNRAYLDTLDLSRFDVIDLDAYGVPYEQLKTIFKRGYSGVVCVTFVRLVYGQLPFGLLRDIGFTDTMIKKSPTLFFGRGEQYLLEWLALHGVSQIKIRTAHKGKQCKNNKHYIAFTCAAVSASDCNSHLVDTAEDHV